jgi:hypothetical protein
MLEPAKLDNDATQRGICTEIYTTVIKYGKGRNYKHSSGPAVAILEQEYVRCNKRKFETIILT